MSFPEKPPEIAPQTVAKPPPFRWNHFLATRKKIFSVMMTELHGTKPSIADITRTADKIAQIIKTDPEVVAKSISELGVYICDKDKLFFSAWRLAGNIKSLRSGKVLRKWPNANAPEWAPLQITSCSRISDKRAEFRCVWLAGSPSGIVFKLVLSKAQLRRYAKSLGFLSPRGERKCYPFRAPEQIVKFRTYGLAIPAKDVDTPPVALHTPETFRRYNRELLKKRYRIDPGYFCPKKFPTTFPCHLCPVGYLNCEAATHREDYLIRICNSCGDKGAFDPEQKTDLCIDCVQKKYRW